MEDRADDIVDVFICTSPSGDVIIVKESIFQATSKKFGGGITQISGYNEFRLSAYNIESGALAARVELGKGIEEECLVIGCVDGKIWCYSVDDELGFHSRSLTTLEVEQTETQLTESGPLAGFDFARPEWVQLANYYTRDESGSGLLLSDMQGNYFRFDPDQQTLKPYSPPSGVHVWPKYPLSNTAEISDDVRVGFDGDGREQPTWKGEIQQTDFSFLKPKFIIDQDPGRLRGMKDAVMQVVKNQVTQLQDSIQAIAKRFPGAEEKDAKYWAYPADKRNAHQQIVELRYQLKNLEHDLENSWTRIGYLNHYPLRADSSSLFVMHAANITDTAGLLISRMDLHGKQFSLTWTTSLPGMYYNPSAADAKGGFETVFSKGDPEFDFQWFTLHHGYLILISQLEMAALDVKSGNLVWRINL